MAEGQSRLRLWGYHDQDLVLSGVVEFHGTVRGTVCAAPGSRLDFWGAILGSLIIQNRALVNLHGSVRGLVLNDGGAFALSGRAGLITDLDGARALIGGPDAEDIVDAAAVRAYFAARDGGPPPRAAPPGNGFGKGLNTSWKRDNAAPPAPRRMGARRAGWQRWLEPGPHQNNAGADAD